MRPAAALVVILASALLAVGSCQEGAGGGGDHSPAAGGDHPPASQGIVQEPPEAEDGGPVTERGDGFAVAGDVPGNLTDPAAEGNATSSAAAEGNSTQEASKYSPRRVFCLPRHGRGVGVDDGTNGTAGADAEGEKAEEETGGESVEEPTVLLMNGSAFLDLLAEQNNSNVTNRSTPAACTVGFFYADWCPFSAAAAPHFNALPRVFPDLHMVAVDTEGGGGGGGGGVSYHAGGLNAQFGVLALPTLILFHNAKPVAKYNLTEYELAPFATYLTHLTGLEPPDSPLEVRERDRAGPVPTAVASPPRTDYYLVLAWAFIAACAVGHFARSSLCRGIVESVRKAWREAEIHHEHED